MGQRLDDARVALAPSSAASAVSLSSASTTKNPAAAGAMSLIVPGLGSFYAGNARHGGVHLGVAAASLVVLVAGIGMSFSECPLLSDQPCNSSSGDFLASVGLISYVVNDVWSVVTAVHDARKTTAGAPTQ
jgi:hypothetical protein